MSVTDAPNSSPPTNLGHDSSAEVVPQNLTDSWKDSGGCLAYPRRRLNPSKVSTPHGIHESRSYGPCWPSRSRMDAQTLRLLGHGVCLSTSICVPTLLGTLSGRAVCSRDMRSGLPLSTTDAHSRWLQQSFPSLASSKLDLGAEEGSHRALLRVRGSL